MNNKIILKKLAKRKLSEFHRWCRVAALYIDLTQTEGNWLVPLLEYDPEDYKDRQHNWQREAPEEVNEIIKAVNAIQKERHRAILIMSFLERSKRSTSEQMQAIKRKSTQYHNLKNRALLEFARLYRDGELLQYIDSEP
ncbi:ArpU family transcriptional regulator [Streptococcus suis]|uniref:Phage encoded ArpU family transcriptional regulator n=1 Tax=Streptococcus suis TaxID=1307 RepID=A0A0Z8IUA9_STRSU|nr:ArpU family phage packaging/lysis transcriptional regulator [Streptococcus suis]NQH17612.1 ArpU family transcriptional regulator [Streptococcus suis]CYV41753.1 phage encoded ArpU family transcriptional regulator [Streptococcus suis]HEL2150587.1 ArpU family transcriptional regulator [Streptococcus suis]